MTAKEKAIEIYEAMYYKMPRVASEKRKDGKLRAMHPAWWRAVVAR